LLIDKKRAANIIGSTLLINFMGVLNVERSAAAGSQVLDTPPGDEEADR
jgi:hypothetical protein